MVDQYHRFDRVPVGGVGEPCEDVMLGQRDTVGGMPVAGVRDDEDVMLREGYRVSGVGVERVGDDEDGIVRDGSVRVVPRDRNAVDDLGVDVEVVKAGHRLHVEDGAGDQSEQREPDRRHVARCRRRREGTERDTRLAPASE